MTLLKYGVTFVFRIERMAYKMEKQSHTSERTGNYRLSEVTASVAGKCNGWFNV